MTASWVSAAAVMHHQRLERELKTTKHSAASALFTCEWHARSWNMTCFARWSLPWWTWQAEEPTEELDQELLTGRRPRNHSGTSARNTWRSSGSAEGNERGERTSWLLCSDWQVDRFMCIYCVIESICTLSPWSIKCIVSLPCHSPLWAVCLKNGLQAAASTEPPQTEAAMTHRHKR